MQPLIVYRNITRKHKKTQIISDFIEFVSTKITGKDPCDIINIDQTPIPFSFQSNKTLKNKGTRSVHLHALTSETKGVTFAVTLDASRSILPPLLIFKGFRHGRIATREFQAYLVDGQYLCQPKAWMDEDATKKWIDLVLVPWKNKKPSGVIPALILGVYRLHMIGSIVNHIQLLWIEVILILVECNYLCQPVDVGFNNQSRWA